MTTSTPPSLLGEPDESADPGRKPGEYVVVARRYRPQTFAELVGQEHVAQALAGAIASQRIGHAYLFTGARGVGKTSAARILAKALNCVEGPTPQPCNRCDACQSISAGGDVDVLEIDGASNRQIDDVRELRHNVSIRPSRSRFKVYIIDEVHMLTREAFNALLKTLEEPPEHVKFIFCTTEAEKIPVTILSRCQRFDFAGIQTSSILARLQQIASTEGVEAEPEALAILARRAAGSMRDSQSLLEQLLAFGGAKITVADVHRMLGTAGDRRLGQLVERLVERNAGKALAELDTALVEGVDVGQLLDQLLGYFRDLMVASVGGQDDALLHVSASEAPQARAAAERLGVQTILAMMQIIDQALARLRYSTHPRTVAELALVRVCKLEDLDELAALVAEVRDGTLPATAGLLRAGAGTAAGEKKSAEPLPQPSEPGVARRPQPAAVGESHSAAASPAVARLEVTPDTITTVWSQVLRQLSDMTSANAEMCQRVAIRAPNRLVVSFPPKYTSCKSFCERPEQVTRLEKALFEATGTALKIEFELLDEPATGPPPTEPPAAEVSPRQRLVEKSAHPLVQRAVELFDAQPVRVE